MSVLKQQLTAKIQFSLYFILGSYTEFRLLLTNHFLRFVLWFKSVPCSLLYPGFCLWGGRGVASACPSTDSSIAFYMQPTLLRLSDLLHTGLAKLPLVWNVRKRNGAFCFINLRCFMEDISVLTKQTDKAGSLESFQRSE